MPNSPKRSVQVLSFFFGFGSWIAITGLWMELPLLTQRLPERWTLGSQLTFMIQAANVGPLLYWIARRKKLCSEVTANHVQMVIGAIACLLLIFAWNKTAYILGKERSVVLLIAAFGLSIVDCTSSVTFLPFMARFRSIYLTPYLVGEGLSGFIPSIVALAQGIGDIECEKQANGTNSSFPVINEPRFSVEVFFSSLLVTLLISWLAFILLQILPVSRKEQEIRQEEMLEKEQIEELSKFIDGTPENSVEEEIVFKLSKSSYIYQLILICWCCFLTFGVMPSIQTYSCLPYGDNILHYSVISVGLAYPAGCFIGMFIELRSIRSINSFTLIGTAITIYIFVFAILSPNPPFKDSTFGGILMIFSWLTFTLSLSYVKTMITITLSNDRGDEGLFWVGMATQFGSAFGAAIMFIVVNYAKVFYESDDSCPS